jgi:hypothetical protein
LDWDDQALELPASYITKAKPLLFLSAVRALIKRRVRQHFKRKAFKLSWAFPSTSTALNPGVLI